MSRVRSVLWMLLALAFLVESWLWTLLEPVIAWLGRIAPWPIIRARIERRLSGLHPWLALFVFAVPFVLVEPLKIVSLWLIAFGHFKAGLGLFVVAYVLTTGVSVLLFNILKPKLMTIALFATAYGWLIKVHSWALEKTAPMRLRLRNMANKLRGLGQGAGMRLLRGLRALRRLVREGK